MRRKRLDKEDRLEQHYRRLGTRNPRCTLCSETDPRCMEKHHIAGCEFDPDIALVCRNCHRKLSDDQLDHPRLEQDAPVEQHTAFGHFLLGLCDLLMMIIQSLREIGEWLINASFRAVASS
jgi:hypothetical protein